MRASQAIEVHDLSPSRGNVIYLHIKSLCSIFIIFLKEFIHKSMNYLRQHPYSVTGSSKYREKIKVYSNTKKLSATDAQFIYCKINVWELLFGKMIFVNIVSDVERLCYFIVYSIAISNDIFFYYMRIIIFIK